MMTEYVILGGVLVVMGAVQIWLRWGSWAKDLQEADKALRKRRIDAVEQRDEQEDADASKPVIVDRGSKLWNKWTAILGPLGVALGVALVIWGVVA